MHAEAEVADFMEVIPWGPDFYGMISFLPPPPPAKLKMYKCSIRTTWSQSFQVTVLTQDWHCQNHVSFASSHDGHKPLDDIQLTYTPQGELCTAAGVKVPGTVQCTGETRNVSQRLWPDHCIADVSRGGTSSSIARNLMVNATDIIVTKGDDCQRDSYSAFYDNGQFNMTRLDAVLRSRGVTRVFLAGFALDYCVMETAKDAKLLGYDTFVILDATRPVAKDTGTKAVEILQSKGVHVVSSDQLTEKLRLVN
ncbi:hypothetical protein Btru_058035, partial [Bulinus truncatus]